jgi:hypothetical protein
MSLAQPLKITSSDVGRWQAISLLLSNDSWLLDFIFTSDRSTLIADPQALIEDSRRFSGGQQLLLQIALHIWTDDGGLSLWDIAQRLDEIRFEAFSLCLEALRS